MRMLTLRVFIPQFAIERVLYVFETLYMQCSYKNDVLIKFTAFFRYSVLSLMGPKSREVLEQVTRVPLDNVHFPFSTVQVRWCDALVLSILAIQS